MRKLVLFVLILAMGLGFTANAEMTQSFGIQGYLTDASGGAVNDTVQVQFLIYSDPTNVNPIDSVVDTAIVSDGVLNYTLYPSQNLCVYDSLWLQAIFDGEEVPERIRLNSTPFSNRSAISKAVVDRGITTQMIDENAVTTPKIADATVTSPKLADNSVTTAKILNGTILSEDLSFTPVVRPLSPPASEGEIADNAITGPKIASNAVGSDEIAANAVGSAEIFDGSIALVDMGSNSVNSAIIVDNSITTNDIVDGTILPADLSFQPLTRPLTPGVATNEIQDGAVTQSKLAPNVSSDMVDNIHASSTPQSSNLLALSSNSKWPSSTIPDEFLTQSEADPLYVNENQNAGGDLSGVFPNLQIQSSTIGSSEIIDGSVSNADLADNSVTTAKIQNSTILFSDINQNSATNGKIIKWNGTAWALSDDNVGIGSVTAGTGLYNSGSQNDPVLNIGDGDGIEVSADNIAVYAPDLAGNGLSSSLNNLNVNTGTGLEISSSSVQLTSNFSSGTAYDSRFVNESQAAGGDLGGTYPNPTVSKLQNRNVSSAAPSNGQVLKWDGSVWCPAQDEIGVSGGDITGVYAESGLSGGGSSGEVTLSIGTDAVTSNMIASSAVGNSELANGSVSESKIANNCYLLIDGESYPIHIQFTGSFSNYMLYANNTGSGRGLYAVSASGHGIEAVTNTTNIGQYAGYFHGGSTALYAINSSLSSFAAKVQNTGGSSRPGLHVVGTIYAEGGIQTTLGGSSQATGYAVPSQYPEIMLSGPGVLINGQSIVTFDEQMLNAISAAVSIKVILTPTSECAGIYVSEKSATGFTAKELNHGKSNATFDWIAICRQAGLENGFDIPAEALSSTLKESR